MICVLNIICKFPKNEYFSQNYYQDVITIGYFILIIADIIVFTIRSIKSEEELGYILFVDILSLVMVIYPINVYVLYNIRWSIAKELNMQEHGRTSQSESNPPAQLLKDIPAEYNAQQPYSIKQPENQTPIGN